MERMRDVLRGSLARSLNSLTPEDRLEAALPVACGSLPAGHCRIIGLGADGVLRIAVETPEWLAQMTSMRSRLAVDLSRIAGVPLAGIHFEGSATAAAPGRPPHRETPPQASARRRTL